jgi:hypothetical protein
MPITARVEQTSKRLHSRASGILTYEDVRYHLQETRGLVAPGYPDLFDARGVETDMTVAQIQSLVSISGEMFKRGALGATAIVVTGHVLFGMTRMYERLNADDISPVHVFLDLPPAEAWLAQQRIPPTTALK